MSNFNPLFDHLWNVITYEGQPGFESKIFFQQLQLNYKIKGWEPTVKEWSFIFSFSQVQLDP